MQVKDRSAIAGKLSARQGRIHELANWRGLIAGLMLALTCMAPAAADDGERDIPGRFVMQDADGALFTDQNLAGKFALLYFGYTGCPDICPTSLMTIAGALKSLGPVADDMVTLFVTVDPDRDSAGLLAQYTAAFDERIQALRGPKAFVDAMAKAYRVQYRFHYPDPADKTNYSVDHSAWVIFQGPDGRVIKRFPHTMDGEAMSAEISAAMAAAAVN
jgi:protein SCO1/2